MFKKIALMSAPVISLLGVQVANAQVTTSTANTAIAGVISDVSSVAATTIVIVLGFVGLLIAAGWGWRFLKKHVGKKI